MVTGSCPGAGKSSLAGDLAGVFGSCGSRVLMICEDDVWGRREFGLDPVSHADALPEFSAVLHDQRMPLSADVLLRTFAQVRARYFRGQAAWIQDWSWLDLASDLLGGRHQGAPLTEFSRDLLEEACDLNPVVLFLRLDPELGLARAVRERGTTWLRRHAGALGATDFCDGDLVRGLVDHYAGQECERLELLGGSGWETLIIDADVDRSAVRSAAVAALGIKSA